MIALPCSVSSARARSSMTTASVKLAASDGERMRPRLRATCISELGLGKTLPVGLHLQSGHRSLTSLKRQAKKAGQQLTLEQMMMDEVELVTAESIGLCSPGHALIRHFFLAVHEARVPYQMSWRQQNAPMSIGSVDATSSRDVPAWPHHEHRMSAL